MAVPCLTISLRFLIFLKGTEKFCLGRFFGHVFFGNGLTGRLI
jgi:hypothetical protein